MNKVAAHLPSRELIEGLERLQEAASFIVRYGPDILWAYAKAVGIDAEVKEHLDERDTSDRAAEENPDSLINRMRRRYKELKQQQS